MLQVIQIFSTITLSCRHNLLGLGIITTDLGSTEQPLELGPIATIHFLSALLLCPFRMATLG